MGSQKNDFAVKITEAEFVKELLTGAGVYRPPCICCLRRAEKSCKHEIGTAAIDCKGYKPQPVSPQKIQWKILLFIRVVQRETRRKKPLPQQLVTKLSRIPPQFAKSE